MARRIHDRSLVRALDRCGGSDRPEPLALRCAGAGREDASLRGDAAEPGGSAGAKLEPQTFSSVRARRRVQKPRAERRETATPGAPLRLGTRSWRFPYHIEFFRGSVLAFSANSTRPQLTVPAHWKDAENSLLGSGRVSLVRLASRFGDARLKVPNAVPRDVRHYPRSSRWAVDRPSVWACRRTPHGGSQT